MTEYIIRRLLAAIPSLVLVSVIIFSLVRLVPGDVVMARLAEGGYANDKQLAEMRAELGIDRPFVVQYIDWASGVVRGDFGEYSGFHEFQIFEAAVRLAQHFGERPEGGHVLIGAARFLTAHSPTVRSAEQTYDTAYRLHRGDVIYE